MVGGRGCREQAQETLLIWQCVVQAARLLMQASRLHHESLRWFCHSPRHRRLMKFQEFIGIANVLQALALARAALAAR